MSRELMKMVGVSVCSSLCTAVFVVACTASADKMDDDERGSGDELAEDDGEGDGGSGSDDHDGDGPGDGDNDNDVSAADLAELAAQIDELTTAVADLKANTFRWETIEATCPDGADDDIDVDVGADSVFVLWERLDGVSFGQRGSAGYMAVIGAENTVTLACDDESGGSTRWRVAYDW